MNEICQTNCWPICSFSDISGILKCDPPPECNNASILPHVINGELPPIRFSGFKQGVLGTNEKPLIFGVSCRPASFPSTPIFPPLFITAAAAACCETIPI
ncbi:hypothetical protein DERP_003021 [Dermatophagoides pteronyssinus]|nr:hypothetical protein DERP_003021 [Dermatophagoides pteronyssinus]